MRLSFYLLKSSTYELAPELVRRIQIAAVQFVILYRAEFWWKDQKNHKYRETKEQLYLQETSRSR